MSNFEDGSYSSLKGIALLGKVLAGRCQMCYTKAVVGKGIIPEGMSPKTMDGPPEYVMDAKIASITNPIDGECQVTVQIKSDDVETGFYLTSIVLYAKDPDLGDVPYTYLSLENGPEWIRPASSIVGKFATFDLIVAVGEIDIVSAVIDPDAIATVGWVNQTLNEQIQEEKERAQKAENQITADMKNLSNTLKGVQKITNAEIDLILEGIAEEEDESEIFGGDNDIPEDYEIVSEADILEVLNS